jgi:hypothetical protein
MWLTRPEHASLADDIDKYEELLIKYEKQKTGLPAIVQALDERNISVGELVSSMLGTNPIISMGINLATSDAGKTAKLAKQLSKLQRKIEPRVEELAASVQSEMNEGLPFSDACAVAGVDGSLLYRLERLEGFFERFEKADTDNPFAGPKGAMLAQGCEMLEARVRAAKQARAAATTTPHD